jgi:uncharacterized protein (TIGR03435 family)
MKHAPAQFAGLGIIAHLLLSPPMFLAQTEMANPPSISIQAPDKIAASLTFETVSIKRSREKINPWSIRSDGDTITITNMSPHLLIGFAYNLPLHDDIYGLPGWTDEEGYDIVAKVPENELKAFQALLPMERSPMLQKVLESRFHLKCHYDTKVLPAYALVLRKGGPRLVETIPGSSRANSPHRAGSMRTRYGEIIGDGVTMTDLATILSQQIGRPIADKTGLNGTYRFKLDWAPEMGSTSTDVSAADSGPSLFTAVQEQLGLKLVAAKVPVRVFVVDRIDRPDQN